MAGGHEHVHTGEIPARLPLRGLRSDPLMDLALQVGPDLAGLIAAGRAQVYEAAGLIELIRVVAGQLVGD